MSERSLPPDLQRKWGYLRWLRYKGNGEWSAECPNCHDDGHDWTKPGDPDRFMIFDHNTGTSGKARGKCRRCGHLEWLDDNPQVPVSPQQQQKNKRERRELAKIAEQKYIDRQTWLRGQTFWREFHADMTAAQRKLWHNAGIGDFFIDMHKLGYSDRDDGALSIPYRDENGIITLQFRLMQTSESDKYRFLTGTRAEIFRVWPDEPLTGVILVTEGVKKGIVTYQQGPYTYQGEDVTVVSVPMKNVPARLIEQMAEAKKLIWLLDPDAYVSPKTRGAKQEPMIARNIGLAGIERSLMVEAPAKIDDMFQMGLTGQSFQHMLSQAKKYIPIRESESGNSRTYARAS